MEGTLIAFRLAPYDKNKASELVKRLHGQRTSSHGGKYVYRRKGLLDEIPHVRLIRGVIIVRTEDAGRVMGLLKEMRAEVHARRIELSREDREALRFRLHGAAAHASGDDRVGASHRVPLVRRGRRKG